MSKSTGISEHVSEISGISAKASAVSESSGLVKQTGMETYIGDDVSGVEKYIRDTTESKKNVKEPKHKKIKSPALLGAVSSDCDCKPLVQFKPCGIPDDTSSVHSDCECTIECERLDHINKQKDSKGKKTKFALEDAPFENTGKLQSPIDVVLSDVVVKNYPALEFSSMYHEYPDRMFTVCADTYEVVFNYMTYAAPRLSGGPLNFPYKFLKFEFHWGADDNDGKGSEHTIDGKAFMMELHAVHIQEQLSTEAAQAHAKGYAILAYFFEIGETDHPVINALLHNFDNLLKMCVQKNEYPSLALCRPFAVGDLINTFSESYITYKGSLTLKPYSENVTWILAPYCIAISAAQMAKFRSLKGAKANNYRELQDRHDRVVNIAERNDNIFRKIGK